MNLSQDVKIVSALDVLAAAAAADRKGAGLDMQGFDGVMMVVKFADIAAGAMTSIKAQQSDDNVDAHYADLAGTGIAIAADDDNQVFIIDIWRPKKRWVRVFVDKDAANATNECALYLQYAPRNMSVTQTVADKVTYELHVEPAEGAA